MEVVSQLLSLNYDVLFQKHIEQNSLQKGQKDKEREIRQNLQLSLSSKTPPSYITILKDT